MFRFTLCRRGPWLAVLLVLIGCAVSGLRFGRSFTNEFHYGKCMPNQTCASCLLGWRADSTCASGVACVAYWAEDAGPWWFKACLATGNSNDWCNTGYMPYPAVTCDHSYYTWCSCRSLATGDCPSSVQCDCDPGNIAGQASFVIDKACY
jgi:hypothetical protein